MFINTNPAAPDFTGNYPITAPVGSLSPSDTSAPSCLNRLQRKKISRINRSFEDHAMSLKRSLEDLSLIPSDLLKAKQDLVTRSAAVLEVTLPQIVVTDVVPSPDGKNHTANGPGSNAFLLNIHSVSKNQSLLMVNNSDCEVATLLSEALQAGDEQHVNLYCRHILESPCDESIKQIQLEAKNPVGVPGLYLALKKDHAHCIKAFFEQVQCSNLDAGVIRKLLAPKGPSDDTPGLRLAMSSGYVNVVDAYCEWILKMENSDLWKQGQLEAIDANSLDMPTLHNAMSEDLSECVTVFCQRILASDLSVQVKEKLAAAETLDFQHTPGLVKAIFKDNHASVAAFCITVLKAELDINMKRRLLESKYYDVTIMQQRGYSNFKRNRAFREYREIVLTSDLNFSTKLSLTSRNLNWLKFHLNPAHLLNRLYHR